MSKIGICLGGVENGKMIYCNDEFYYALVGGDIVNYRKIDLKFIKEIRQSHFQKSYVLNQPFKIYVPESEYYEYEGALKFILSKWMEAEWGSVMDSGNFDKPDWMLSDLDREIIGDYDDNKE